jgi:hypothetical protein
MTALLEKEYKIYLVRRHSFVRDHCNKFVLIKGEHVIDFFPSYEQALTAGLKKFGNKCFFIKECCKKEEEHLV